MKDHATLARSRRRLPRGTLVSERGPAKPGYTAASGEQASAAIGTRVLVRFTPTAGATQIAHALIAVGAEIVGGPKPGRLFEVRLSTEKLAKARLVFSV